jgi:hypothetical protein
MKERLPRSFAAAVYRVIEALGAKVSAHLVNRSTAALYKWSDPDLTNFPTLDQALVLDREFMRLGLGPPPIFVAYKALLRVTPEHDGDKRSLSTADALADINELVSTATAILRDFAEGQLVSRGNLGGKAGLDCKLCVRLRRVAELVASLEWKIEQDQTGEVCPLQADTAGKIRCLR